MSACLSVCMSLNVCMLECLHQTSWLLFHLLKTILCCGGQLSFKLGLTKAADLQHGDSKSLVHFLAVYWCGQSIWFVSMC